MSYKCLHTGTISMLLLSAFLFLACNPVNRQQKARPVTALPATSRFYATSVGDSFSVSVQLPAGYRPDDTQRYPVVYLLDANIYFDIMAATLRQYSQLGLAPDVILVGVGYKDLYSMDSLRSRDYTYPLAIPEYEMAVSGGADKFLQFLGTGLVPDIESRYKTDTAKRVLMGHSLGAYCTMYALLQHIQGKQNIFRYYIAASPSLHYNNYYLPEQLRHTTPGSNTAPVSVYLTYGGLEDEEDEEEANKPGYIKNTDVIGQLNGLFGKQQPEVVQFKGTVFSGLGHMDTQLPTFIKGLQWTLQEAP